MRNFVEVNSDRYIISIDKESLSAMPTLTYEGEIRLLDTPADARIALRELSKFSIVGFDTETRPAFRKGCMHKVALLQISTGTHCYLFRLNKIGVSEELKAFLENRDILKVGLSVHDDFNALRRSCEGIEPQGFIDIQDMVKSYGFSDISLQKIYAILFGERISKGQRLTNWEAAELSPAQQAYASIDAQACLKIYNYLNSGDFDPKTSPYRHIYVTPVQQN